MTGSEEMELRFLKDETLDCGVYSKLAEIETNSEIRALLRKLALIERRHVAMWRSLLGSEARGKSCRPMLLRPKILLMVIVRKLLGVAFVVKFLERHEKEDLKKYQKSLLSKSASKRYKDHVRGVIRDCIDEENELRKEADLYKGDLRYTESIVLGLNDGLVEILAIIAGLAIVADANFVVVVTGLIAGLSGTLSMAGGVYLSAKSDGLVKRGEDRNTSARKKGYYAGVYYFLGALLAVLPFMLGIGGIAGIVVSMALVSMALSAASAVIAIISETSIRKRTLEMVAISLAAAITMIIVGELTKIYLGVSI
jgi:vacuolar iron transporter family protein